MSTTSSNTGIFINQSASGFPDYLDFGKMRSEVIAYLGPITSAYWTDYNEHDPGITTLEALLYALVDLGYRVNWPIADLLAQKTGVAETDFFTPAQVLGCNPWTLNDYRKLLMDLKEVRNAWLNPAGADGAGGSSGMSGPAMGGLYEVWLDLEQGPSDFATADEWN
ncbi:MAG TPA: hypothetical protein VNU70_05230, partial [Puia sp.]|nr:hypothetical protein [Puia sp.]